MDFRGRERKRDGDSLFHLVTHSLVGSCTCPDRGSNPPPPRLVGDNAVTNLATLPGHVLICHWRDCFSYVCRPVTLLVFCVYLSCIWDFIGQTPSFSVAIRGSQSSSSGKSGALPMSCSQCADDGWGQVILVAAVNMCFPALFFSEYLQWCIYN